MTSAAHKEADSPNALAYRMWPKWYQPPMPIGRAHRIIGEVARAFGMTPDQLKSPDRRRPYVVARGVAIRILRDCRRDGVYSYSTPQIASYVGRRDHTTVLHALDNFPIWMRYDPDARDIYETLRALAA